MEIQRLPPEGHLEVPWANGRGVPRELAVARAPDGSSAPFLWRASMADLDGDGTTGASDLTILLGAWTT